MTPAARRYRRAWCAHLELYLRLHEARPSRRERLLALIRQSEAELAAAQTAYAREAPWQFAVLRDDGRD